MKFLISFASTSRQSHIGRALEKYKKVIRLFKMRNFLKLFALLVVYCQSNQGIVIDCIYADNPTWGYYCRMQNAELVTSKDCREITGVQGFHLSGKTNDDVKLLSSWSIFTKIAYFPQNLTGFFKNLEYIEFQAAGMKEITKDDLKEFGSILKRFFVYSGNDIEIIEKNLFEYNKNLEWIYLAGNKIKHIENGAFDGLQNLNRLELQSNPCTSETDTTTDSSKLITIIRSVETKCKDPSYLFLEAKNSRIKELENEIEELKLKVQQLQGTINENGAGNGCYQV